MEGLQVCPQKECHHSKGQGPPVMTPQTALLGPKASLLFPCQEHTRLKAGELYPISSLNCNYCPFSFIVCLSTCLSQGLSFKLTTYEQWLWTSASPVTASRGLCCYTWSMHCWISNRRTLGSPLSTELHSQGLLSLSISVSQSSTWRSPTLTSRTTQYNNLLNRC